MMELTERQLAWLRTLFADSAAREHTKEDAKKDPNHPQWQEYDHLHALNLPR